MISMFLAGLAIGICFTALAMEGGCSDNNRVKK